MSRKLLFILMILGLVSLTAFLIIPSDAEIITSELNDELTFSVKRVESNTYAELNNSDPRAYDNDLIYFLRIENSSNTSPLLQGIQDETEYGQRVSYFSDQIKYDLSIIQGIDTVPCSFVHWERSFTSRPFITITAIFQSMNSSEPRKLQWLDPIYSGIPQRLRLN